MFVCRLAYEVLEISRAFLNACKVIMLGTGSNRFVEISKLLFGCIDFFRVLVCGITDQCLKVLQACLHRLFVLQVSRLGVFQIFCMLLSRLPNELLKILHPLVQA